MSLNTKPGLHIELAQDHTKLLVELPSGHHISIPINPTARTSERVHKCKCGESHTYVTSSSIPNGFQAIVRLLLEQKRQAVTDHENAQMADFQSGQRAMIDHWLQYGVGTEVSPTQQKFDHDLRHDPRWPRPNCVFCRQEEAEKAARRRVRKAKDKVYRPGMPELSLEDLD